MLDKLFAAFLRRTDEGTLSRLLVEVSVVLASGRGNGTNALRDAAAVHKVDTDTIALEVTQEFAAKASLRPKMKPGPLPRSRKQPSSISARGGEPAASRFVASKNRAGRTSFGFSLHPPPARPGPARRLRRRSWAQG
jgi:hypothetical protein